MSRFRRQSVISVFFVLALALFACGKENPKDPGGDPVKTPDSNPKPPDDTTPGKAVTLVVFGAEWCTVCKAEFPKLQELIRTELGRAPGTLTKVMWVTSGKNAAERPTQEIADRYKDFLHMEFEARPDPWRWQNFKKFISASDLTLPAAVILGKDEAVLGKFPSREFSPEKVVAAVKVELNRK